MLLILMLIKLLSQHVRPDPVAIIALKRRKHYLMIYTSIYYLTNRGVSYVRTKYRK